MINLEVRYKAVIHSIDFCYFFHMIQGPHIIPAAVMVATRLVVDPLDPWIPLGRRGMHHATRGKVTRAAEQKDGRGRVPDLHGHHLEVLQDVDHPTSVATISLPKMYRFVCAYTVLLIRIC